MTPLPHSLPLRTDAAAFGVHRIVVPTSVGEIVVRAGRRAAGPATVLLHGAAGTWTTWTPLLAASALSPSGPLTDVIALDLPGWGESAGIDRIHSVADVSDSVAEVVRALGYDTWHLVGHSLGGFVALDVAARHADATLSVTLVSASGAAVVDAIRHPVRGGIALPGFAGMLLAMRTLSLVGAAGRAFVRFLDGRGWMPRLTAPLFVRPLHPTVVAAFADEVRPASFCAAARFAADYEQRSWTGIRCPVRSVRGAHDVFAGEADAAAFCALIPDFREVRLSDAGHFAHIERPDAVLEALRTDSFAGGTRRRAGALPGVSRPRTAQREAA